MGMVTRGKSGSKADGTGSGRASVPDRQPLTPLLAALRHLADWFKAAGIQGIIVGGVAASILGRPRFTRDIDALVILEEERWPELLETGKQCGFDPRLSDPLEFARRSRVLLLRHRGSGIDVDLAFGTLPFEEEALRRFISVKVSSVTIPLASPDDLVIMKAVAGRPQDWLDIESLLAAHPDLDLDRVRRWVGEFSSALESPEILEELEKVVSRARQK